MKFDDLADLSLEELMSIDISTVTEKAQNALSRASASYTISREDIEHSGRRTIPEILRMAPGVHVGRVDNNKWTVSLRGFNGRFSNNYLVLLDGRTMYSRSIPGINWQQIDTIIEDIEKIDVIRGPGASLWGSNAVNGVINIMTRSARETHGLQLALSSGSATNNETQFRYGMKLGNSTHLRLYGKHTEHDAFEDINGQSAHDENRRTLLGFRSDRQPDDKSSLTISGEYTQSHPDDLFASVNFETLELQVAPTKNKIDTFHLRTHWTKRLNDKNQVGLQIYYDREERDTTLLVLERDTIDIDLKQHLSLGKTHSWVWGFGYRFSQDDLSNTNLLTAVPNDLNVKVAQAFVQDQIQVTPNLSALLGVKVEDNSFSDIEIQPSLKFSLTLGKAHLTWLSVAKAVRTPTRVGTQVRIDIPSLLLEPGSELNVFPLPLLAELAGNSTLESEELIAYELGHQWQLSENFNIDLAIFYNDYSKLNGTEFSDLLCQPGNVLFANDPACLGSARYLETPLLFNNSVSGHTLGGELVIDKQMTARLSSEFNISYIKYELASTSIGFLNELADVRNPELLTNLKINYRVDERWSLDFWLRHVGKVEGFAALGPGFDSYTALDLRAAMQVNPFLQLEIVGANLTDSGHLEGASELGEVESQPIPRSLRATIKLLF
ncbi:MAG: TonB-dependent receptor [Pseudomonadota bacterium]